MIRVGVFPADEGGCGHYRIIWPWEEIARQFADELEVLWAKDIQDKIMIEWTNGPWGDGEPTQYQLPQDIVMHPDLDVAVFQRPLHRKFIEYFRLLRERGTLIVVDLDDNFERIARGNVAWYSSEPHWMMQEEIKKLAHLFGEVTVTKKTTDDVWHFVPAHSGATHRRHVYEALAHTDLLIVSTPALAEQYGGYAQKTIVIPNYVNDWYFDHVRDEENLAPIVGWTGSIATHPNDLDQMGPALSVLRRKGAEFQFKIVGTGKGVAHVTGETPDLTTLGWVSLTDGSYQREYAAMDIALCPLETNEFNRGKSWLKPLEACALGVVPVMSDLPEYERLGMGLIARKPRQWESQIRRLLTDAGLRRAMREENLQRVRDEFTYQGNAHRWVEAIVYALSERFTRAAG